MASNKTIIQEEEKILAAEKRLAAKKQRLENKKKKQEDMAKRRSITNECNLTWDEHQEKDDRVLEFDQLRMLWWFAEEEKYYEAVSTPKSKRLFPRTKHYMCNHMFKLDDNGGWVYIRGGKFVVLSAKNFRESYQRQIPGVNIEKGVATYHLDQSNWASPMVNKEKLKINLAPQVLRPRFIGPISKQILKDLSFFLNVYIKDNLCGGNQTVANYLMLWLAKVVRARNSHERPLTTPVFLSPQGTGKSTLVKFIENLMDDGICGRMSWSSFYKGYLQSIMDKRFVSIDEFPDRKEDGATNAADTLKALITEPTYSFEEKYKPVIQTAVCSSFMICTNNAGALANFEGRRYFFPDVSTKYIDKNDNEEFWRRVISILNNSKFYDAWYRYLLELDLSKYKVPPPTTRTKEDLIQRRLSFPMEFLVKKYALDVERFWDTYPRAVNPTKEPEIKIKTAMIFNEYQRFLSDKGKSLAPHRNKFFKELNEFDCGKYASSKGAGNVSYYTFKYYSLVESLLKCKMVGEDDFDGARNDVSVIYNLGDIPYPKKLQGLLDKYSPSEVIQDEDYDLDFGVDLLGDDDSDSETEIVDDLGDIDERPTEDVIGGSAADLDLNETGDGLEPVEEIIDDLDEIVHVEEDELSFLNNFAAYSSEDEELDFDPRAL